MIELIIVIIIAGILAAVMIPSMERDSLRESANQLVRHIQFTQHLAMVDDVYDADQVNWERALWSVNFRTNHCYAVQSDSDFSNGRSREESAIDPLTGLRLYSNTGCTADSLDNGDLLLKKKYDTNLSLSTSCGSNLYIAFDNLGRPLKTRKVSDPVTSGNGCTIRLQNGVRTALINIEAETGYTRIIAIDEK